MKEHLLIRSVFSNCWRNINKDVLYMMKVLITGGNGFIGTALAQLNHKNGNQVEVWDVCSDYNGPYPAYSVDLHDDNEIEKRLKGFRPDIIFHCAGSANVRNSVENPKMDFESNVALTHNLLFALHKLNMHSTRVVFLSSAAVYGNPTTLPISENAELKPLSPYALHKVMCEEICTYFRLNYNIDVRIARIFSAYGNGLKKQILWDMYQKMIKTSELNMFGTGAESRDYIHILDVVQALTLIAETDYDEQYIYNVANGEEVKISEITEIFAQCGKISKDSIKFNGYIREGDPLNWCADISRLKALGYQKKVEIHNGVSDYYSWVSQL